MLTKTTAQHASLLAALLGVAGTAPPSKAQSRTQPSVPVQAGTAVMQPSATASWVDMAIAQANSAAAQTISAPNLPAPTPLADDIFTLCMRAAYRCYGAEHANCTFYFAAHAEEAPPHGVLCVQGRSALYSGAMHDADELESFLGFLQVKSFKSNSMLLPNWKPVPQYLMHLSAGGAVHVCAASVDEHPDLWALAHSGVLTDIDPDAWYADACSRTNKAIADVRAIAVPPELRADAQKAPSDSGANNTESPAVSTGVSHPAQPGATITAQSSNVAPQYAATAGAYAIDEADIYITAVETKADYRGCGFGCTLISSLARAYADKDKWLLCKPALHGFYEQLGFVFARPVCEYHAPV